MHPNAAEAALDRAISDWHERYADLVTAVIGAMDREVWRVEGAGSMVSWLAREFSVTRSTARRWIADGRALTAGHPSAPRGV